MCIVQATARETAGCSSLVAMVPSPPPRSTTRPPTRSAPAPPCLIVDISTQQVSPAPSPALTALYNADLTDAGVILCGGVYTLTSCLRLAAGNSEWEQFATISERYVHTSWVTSTGKLLLLGGWDGGNNRLATTEVVGEGASFRLQRSAR